MSVVFSGQDFTLCPKGKPNSTLLHGISSHINKMFIYVVKFNIFAVESDSECDPMQIEQCTNIPVYWNQTRIGRLRDEISYRG